MSKKTELIPSKSDRVLSSYVNPWIHNDWIIDNWIHNDWITDNWLNFGNKPKRNSATSNCFYEVLDNEDNLTINIQIPNFTGKVSKEDIDVSIEGDVLSVSTVDLVSAESNNVIASNSVSSMRFCFGLKSNKFELDYNGISAKVSESNVLEIIIPKSNKIKSNVRKITVE